MGFLQGPLHPDQTPVCEASWVEARAPPFLDSQLPCPHRQASKTLKPILSTCTLSPGILLWVQAHDKFVSKPRLLCAQTTCPHSPAGISSPRGHTCSHAAIFSPARSSPIPFLRNWSHLPRSWTNQDSKIHPKLPSLPHPPPEGHAVPSPGEAPPQSLPDSRYGSGPSCHHPVPVTAPLSV